MFTSHETTIDTRFEEASARLVSLISRDALRGVSGIAYDTGVAAAMRVGPFGSVRGLSKLVDVRFLAPVRRGATMTVALRWEAAGATGELFPVLDADLILAGYGAGQSRLAITGSYRPPFGRAGAALDRAIMRRLAAATMRSLLTSIADSIAHPAPELQQATNTAPQSAPESGQGPFPRVSPQSAGHRAGSAATGQESRSAP